MSDRVEKIRSALTALSPLKVDVIDESHKHVGHVGAQDGRGHFKVMVLADVFADKTVLQRHRMIYDAVGELMQTDIHALSIVARAPGDSST